MQRIDAHQHFWNYDPIRDIWITNSMQVIKRNFLPPDLKPLLEKNGIQGCVAVQAHQSESETDFLISLAQKFEFIKGIVGWVNLQADEIGIRLEHYKNLEIVKGFRHILQSETNRAFMLQPKFLNGIKRLQEFNFTYDILIYQDQLIYTDKFVALFPGIKFIIDHLGKPDIKRKSFDDWQKGIKALGKYNNVYCKISGLVTETDWHNWKKEDFTPYLDTVVEAFGTDRLLYGSDWPVCLLSCSYDNVFGIVNEYFSTFSLGEQEKIFGLNAIQFYNL